MSDHIFKNVELTGTSTSGSDDAIKNALAKANESIRDIQWFHVIDSRGYVKDGVVNTWQVTIKVGFRLAD
jgi:flavin-binding protein dodecin